VLAAGVQQCLVRPDQLDAALGRRPRLRRHALIAATLADIAGWAQALSELDFARLARRYGLPAPDRQVMRLDRDGRRRWLDAYWEEAHLAVEVDGLWHMEATAWWADMRRGNDLMISGLRVLRSRRLWSGISLTWSRPRSATRSAAPALLFRDIG
jgi:hypothetical protein